MFFYFAFLNRPISRKKVLNGVAPHPGEIFRNVDSARMLRRAGFEAEQAAAEDKVGAAALTRAAIQLL